MRNGIRSVFTEKWQFPECSSTHVATSDLAMRAIPVVIVAHAAIVDHGGNVWVVMLQGRRKERERKMRERDRQTGGNIASFTACVH